MFSVIWMLIIGLIVGGLAKLNMLREIREGSS